MSKPHPALTDFFIKLTALVGQVAHNPEVPLTDIARVLEEKASYLRSLDVDK